MLRYEGKLEYSIKRLVRGDIAWRYEGVTHEYLPATNRPIRQFSTLWSSWTTPTEDRVTTSSSATHVC